MGNSAEGESGYFLGKNYLGQFAAVAFLLSLHELKYSGQRRFYALVVAIASYYLLVESNSKTSLGLAFGAPILAAVTLVVHRLTRLSPGAFAVGLVTAWIVGSKVTGFTMARLSNLLYGDPTFTGRQVIWDFLSYEISRKPLLGWGYQSFWLVGPNGPSVLDAPGWVKLMPSGHSGYYDTTVELGYVGLWAVLIFVITTFHLIGRIADRDPSRGFILLTLAIFVAFYNGFESLWFRGFEITWVVFVFVVAEVARVWTPAQSRVRKRAKPRMRPGYS